jgi:(p)ppGpp synthase/HD superfamily hydrolase
MTKSKEPIYTPPPRLLVERADVFAMAAHGGAGQLRKYTGIPYVEHPRAVSRIVSVYGGSEAMVAAALLHDVVEDTKVDIEDIVYMFGVEVAELVDWMTDKTTPDDGNRATRKKMERERWAGAPPEAKMIKPEDCIDNGHDITANDPDFAKVYLSEMRLLLPLIENGSYRLANRLSRIIESGLPA